MERALHRIGRQVVRWTPKPIGKHCLEVESEVLSVFSMSQDLLVLSPWTHDGVMAEHL
jgi:hypothetical protein